MTNLDELNESVSGTEMSEVDTDYVAAIQELQNNTVSKSEYNKLRSENKKLLDALVSGQKIEIEKEPEVDVNALRKDLFGGSKELSNLEYVEDILKLRKAVMDKGEEDPFLPVGEKVTITAEMRDKAEQVAQGLQYCVDFADGDSGIFTAQLQRITKDVPLPKRKGR